MLSSLSAQLYMLATIPPPRIRKRNWLYSFLEKQKIGFQISLQQTGTTAEKESICTLYILHR